MKVSFIMPYLIVFRNDEKIMEHKVVPHKQLRIGRGRDNDIVLSDSAVSGLHAEIECDDGFYYVTDYQSKNGTFVNRELVISRRLAHDDVISMGSHNLKFIFAEGEQVPTLSDTSHQGATMHIDTPHHRSRLARSVAKIAERGSRSGTLGMINLLKADSKPVLLDKPVSTIGRDTGCDIQVKGWFTAGIAAEIHKKSGGYYLHSVSGKPPLVNSKPVNKAVLLNEFDMIQVGSTSMQFEFQKDDNTESTRIL